MSADENKAVFLSYASQDAEAAKRICEALRAGGVEVWFDADGGLEHGDEWDAKIRRQIKECVLFIPVISTSTQARHEGYFRIEWELAAQRAMGIASGVPFILPVVIDDTREPDALVPDRFRSVQWTRLPDGVVTPEVQARYLKLWSHRTGVLKHEENVGRGRRTPPAVDERGGSAGFGDPALQQKHRRVPAAAWGVAAIAVALVVGGYVWLKRPTESTPTPAQSTAEKPAVPLSPAGKLLDQARSLLETGDDMNRENLILAEDMLKQANALDPNDADVLTAQALLSDDLINFGYDKTTARLEIMRTQADRAVKLAPTSDQAKFAYALYLLRVDFFSGQPTAASRDGFARLQALVVKTPQNKSYHRALAFALRENPATREVAYAEWARANALPGGDALAMAEAGMNRFFDGNLAEAERAIAASLATRPIGRALTAEVLLKLCWRGDLDGAVAAMQRWPGWLMQEERGAYVAAIVWLWRKDYDKALGAIRAVNHEVFRDTLYEGPRAVLEAIILEAAGRPEAANAEWQRAVKVTDAMTEPSWMPVVYRVLTHAKIGDQAGAEAALRVLVQSWMGGKYEVSELQYWYWSLVFDLRELVTGPTPASFPQLEKLARGEIGAGRKTPRAALQLNPAFEVWRKDPRFAALAAAAPAPEDPVAPAAKVDEKAVAVLPFANLSGDKEQEYFSDGLTEEILHALERERDLRVPGRASSFSFKGKNASAAEIASALNVSRLVEGSVQRAGSKVRIRVSLTRVADNASEELGTFTEEFADIFALYDKVARAVVEKLAHRQLASSVEVLTKNSAAHDFYLRGRALQTRAASYAGEAAKLYEQAVALDPKFALAWARLAEARFRYYGGLTDRSPDVVNGTREAVDRALAVQPDLPEALIMRANWVRNIECDYAGARRDLNRAEGLQAVTADLRKAQGLLEEDTGNWPEAFRFYREALSLDPLNSDFINSFAIENLMRGDFAEADRLFARAMSIQGPGVVIPFGNRVALRSFWRGPEAALLTIERAPAGQAGIAPWRAIKLAEAGRGREARAEIEALSAPSNDLSNQVIFVAEAVGLIDLAHRWAEKVRADAEKEFARGNRAPMVRLDAVNAEIILGHRDVALALLEDWRREQQQVPSVSRRMFDFGVWAASAYGRLGRADEAVALLREMETEGFKVVGYDLRYNLAWAPIRNDPRFQELMQHAEAWAKAQPDPVDL